MKRVQTYQSSIEIALLEPQIPAPVPSRRRLTPFVKTASIPLKPRGFIYSSLTLPISTQPHPPDTSNYRKRPAVRAQYYRKTTPSKTHHTSPITSPSPPPYHVSPSPHLSHLTCIPSSTAVTAHIPLSPSTNPVSRTPIPTPRPISEVNPHTCTHTTRPGRPQQRDASITYCFVLVVLMTAR